LQEPQVLPPSTHAYISLRTPSWGETLWIPHEGNFVVHGADSLIRELDKMAPQGGTEADVLKRLLSIDLAALLRSAPFASELIPPATPDSLTYEMLPLVILDANYELKPKEETESGKKELTRPLRMSCSLYVQLLKGVKPIWRTRYHVQLSQKHFLTPALDVEGVRAELQGCLVEAHRLFAGYLDHSLEATGKYKFRAKHYGNQKSPLVESELPERVIMGDEFGFIELPRDFVIGEIESQQKSRR
jgi:hypothetical protein